jgi:Fe-S cluster assembly protein SufD
VCEVFVGENAALEHVLTQHASKTSAALTSLYVSQAANSRYTSRVVTLGGAVSRLDLTLRFAGPGAESVLDGLYWATDEEHVEHHLRVEHCASHCTSNQKYKGVLDARARGPVRSGGRGAG